MTALNFTNASALWVDARKYGVIPNSASDQQTAIQAALNSGHPIEFPPGQYITSPLTIPSRGAVRGAGMDLTRFLLAPDSIPPDNPFTNHSVFQNQHITSIEYGGGAEPQDHDIYIGHLSVDGNEANQTSTTSEAEGINLYGVKRAIIESVRVENTVADGIDLDYCDLIQIRNFIIDGCRKSGMHLSIGSPQGINRGNNNCAVVDGLIMNCGGAGLTDFLAGSGGMYNRFENIIAIDCKNELPTFEGAVSILSTFATLRNIAICNTNVTSTQAGVMEGLVLGGDDIMATDLDIDTVAGTASDGRGAIISGNRIAAHFRRIKSTNNNGLRYSGCDGCTAVADHVFDIGSNGVVFRDGATNNGFTGTIDSATNNGMSFTGLALNNVARGVNVHKVGTTAGNNHGAFVQSGSTGNAIVSCNFGALPLGQGIDDQATGTLKVNNINE